MQISRTALVPHSASDMYQLVRDVPAYPEFLTWCSEAEVHEETGGVQVATLVVSVGGMRQSFTTRNELEPGRRVDMELVEGPFRSLGGVWTFQPLGTEGSKVILDLEFEFGSSSLISGAFRRGFSQIADRLVRDFCARAEEVY